MQREQEIFAVLKKLMLNFLDINTDDLTPATQLSSLGLESLDFVEIQVELEKRYGVKIDSAVFISGELRTLGDFATYVGQQIGEQAA